MRQSSFNVVHLAVALFVVMVIIVLLLPAIGHRHHHPARRMQNATQLRGIHQGLVTYANSNNKWFPGIDLNGEDEGISVETRFQILLEEDYFTPEYAISPSETEGIIEWDQVGPVTKDNYSYAMLQIPKSGGRRAEWSQTINSQAIVLSDRNTGTQAKPSSIFIKQGGTWAGSVLWNDNHVDFEDTDAYETKYGDGELNEADRLFESEDRDNALMIHSGN